MQNGTLIFIHIPKNAGTSMRRIVESFYKEKEIYFIYTKAFNSNDESDFIALPETDKKNIRIIFGHVSVGFHNHITQPSSYVTILRHPVERMVSLYSFVSNNPDHPFYETIKSNNMDFDEFMREEGMQWGMSTDNQQTRMLCGMKADFRKCYPEMVSKAKENLRERFAVIGLSEYFVESVLLMKNTFGWKIPISTQFIGKILGWKNPLYEKTNVTEKKLKINKLSESSLDAVKKFNELDIELYNYARDLFFKQIEAQGPRFMKKVENIKSKL